MADSKQLLQAISYFQKYPVYEKLFSLMKQKYARLGHFGGTFVLDSLTDSDRGTLSGFLGMDIADMEPVKILFTRLNAALGKSRFAALSWEDILTKYYGMPLLVNRDVHLQRQQEKEAFFQACLSDCKDPDIRNWLAEVLLEQKSGCRIIEKQFTNDAMQLRQMLQRLTYALERLPARRGQKQLLPVFAAMTTGNPHYFDDGTTACNLLLNYGAYRYGQSDTKLSGIEQRESLLYQMGLLKDSLSNTCLAYGILGQTADSALHQGLYGFCQEKQALQITLGTLSQLRQLVAASEIDTHNLPAAPTAAMTETATESTAHTIAETTPLTITAASALTTTETTAHAIAAPQKRHAVYILENPSAFSYLVSKYPMYAFLCTTGQLKLASYAAMDLFPDTYTFYYAGDFDPEGLQIAQDLKKRYGSRMILWNYTKEYYQQAISDLTLSPARIHKLEKIIIKDLLEIKQCLLTEKHPAYQEKILDSYLIETLAD
jgi:hypothetical protein